MLAYICPHNEQDHNQQTLVAQFEFSDRVNLFFVVTITKSAHTADFVLFIPRRHGEPGDAAKKNEALR